MKIATVLVVVILVVAAVVAGGSASYYAANNGSVARSTTSNTDPAMISRYDGGNISTTTVATSTTTATNFSSSSSYSSSSSSSAISPLNPPGVVTTWKDYLGNFTEFTVEYNESGEANSTFSYRVLGHPLVNSTELTEVNFTVSTTGSSSESSLIGWFDPEGNATMITEGGYNYTGSIASQATLEFASAFEVGFFTSANLAILGESTNLGTAMQDYGPTRVNVTSYDYSQGGKTWDIRVGNLPGTSLDLLTNYAVWSGSTEQVGFRLVSLTGST